MRDLFHPDATIEILWFSGLAYDFIGASEKPEQELGIVFKPDHETLHSADVFKDLKLPREIAREPLLEGEWA